MCASCRRRGPVDINRMPHVCPVCGNKFHQEHSRLQETITEILYSLVMKDKPEQGYFICDKYGFIQGDGLLFPNERM